MRGQTEHGIEVIIEILCDSEIFTDEEISLIEDYFEDGADEILDKIEYREEYDIEMEMLQKEMCWLIQNGQDEAAERAGRLFFKIWEMCADECFPLEMFSDECSVMASEPEKRAAIYVTYISGCGSRLHKPYLKRLMNYAQNDPEIVRKAYDYRGKCTSESIVLLAVYFLLKYPEVKLEDEEGGLAALLERQGITGEEAERDLNMLKQYEHLVLKIFDEIYYYDHPKEITNKIKKAIKNDRLDDKILKMAAANVLPNCPKIYLNDYRKCQVGGMSFINFPLSRRLKNVVRACLAARADEMLYVMDSMDMRGYFEDRGGSFDQILGVDSCWLIECAAVRRKDNILKEQFGRNREIYLKCMNDMSFTLYHYMSEVIWQVDEKFHKEREQEELARQQEELITALMESVYSKYGEAMKKYLYGETGVDALYPFWNGIPETMMQKYRHWNMLSSYRRFYGYDTFCKRCEAALMICGGFDNFNYLLEDGELKEERVRELFRAMDEIGLSLHFQMRGFADMYFSLHTKEKWRVVYLAVGKEIFAAYYKERSEEMQEVFRQAERPGRLIALQIFSQGLERPSEGEEEPFTEELIHFCQDPAEEVRDALVEILCRAKNREAGVIGLLSSQVKDERKIAIRVLTKWEDEKYALNLKKAFIEEKDQEIRAFLEAVLPVDKLIRLEGSKGLEDIVRELHKGNKKRTLAWTCETPFSKVHKKDGKEADEEYLQAILLAYAAMDPKGDIVPYGVSSTARALAGQLDEREYAVYVNELFDKWVKAGADTKKRWVLFVAVNHGDADMPARLFESAQEWASGRKPVAIEAVRALCLSLRPEALLMVEGMSRKFKVNKIRVAAKKALKSTASWLGLTKEGLMDRTVPDLGFDENRERVFDYGTRKFIVNITADFEVQVSDESGKKLKNLPVPGKRDDEAKATVACEEFKQLKKQVKTMVKSQKERLDTALANGRKWDVERWKDLFLGNPVMYRLAMGLIWGIYEYGELAVAFRYREDGTFYVENIGKELSAGSIFLTEEIHSINEMLPVKGNDLSRCAKIGLVHPLELSEVSLRAWRKHLEEYGIEQPIEQLDRPVFLVTEEEADQEDLERFKGLIMKERILKNRLQLLGWNTDLGEEIFCKENQELSLGVEIGMEEYFEYYESGEMGNVMLYEVKFYDLSGKDDYDQEYYLLKDVPERYFSDVVLELTRATDDYLKRDMDV